MEFALAGESNSLKISRRFGNASRVQKRRNTARTPRRKRVLCASTMATFWTAAVLRRFQICLRSPIFRESNHLARFLKVREQLADRLRLVRQHQLWPDVGERLKHEFPQMHPRMWQLQLLGVDLCVAKIEEIDIDLARDIVRMTGSSTKRTLDLAQFFQKPQRIAHIIKFKDRIQKFLRTRFAIDRVRFVNGGGKNWRLDAGKINNFLSRRAQIIEPIAKIRSERNRGSHSGACVPLAIS
jgi:hypothetical protein